AVPASILELLAQELAGQRLVRLFEIGAEAEDSAVDAGLRFAVKKAPVVVILKPEPALDAADHFAGIGARRIETEVLQDDQSVEGKEQAWAFLRPAPVAGTRLERENLRSPAFRCDARPLGCNRVRRFARQVPHDLPADRRVRIEEPFELRGPGRVIL